MQKLHTQKLAIIGTVGLPAKYGGFETLAQQLVLQLNKQFDMTVYCSGKRIQRSSALHIGKGQDCVTYH